MYERNVIFKYSIWVILWITVYFKMFSFNKRWSWKLICYMFIFITK